MWMIGCGESNSLSISDSLHSVKLRPLIPRPVSSSDVAYRASSLSLISGTDFLSSDAYKNSGIEHNKPPVSSRWNPTPEQLRTLEDLYQRGTRTPTAEQIRHITAQLRRFGKIEGKNVFYWFQNHKARERQKRRRRSEASLERELEKLQCKDSGFETQQCKNLSRPTNYSRVTEEPASLPTSTDTESRNEKWARCNTDIHSMEIHPKWLSSTFSTKETSSEKDLINHESVDIFMVTHNENESGKSQILELFPLRSGGGIRNEKVVSSWIEVSNSMEMSRSGPQKFFEFL